MNTYRCQLGISCSRTMQGCTTVSFSYNVIAFNIVEFYIWKWLHVSLKFAHLFYLASQLIVVSLHFIHKLLQIGGLKQLYDANIFFSWNETKWKSFVTFQLTFLTSASIMNFSKTCYLHDMQTYWQKHSEYKQKKLCLKSFNIVYVFIIYLFRISSFNHYNKKINKLFWSKSKCRGSQHPN